MTLSDPPLREKLVNTLISRLFAISTIAALTACGAGNSESARYDGSTLFIDGIPYSQGEKPKNIVPGEIIVVPKDGMREEVRKLIAEFQLRILREDSRSFLVVVPLGFEQQWATAFSKQNAVAGATTSPLLATR